MKPSETTADILGALPELPLEPFEVAGKLGRSDRGSYLTIRANQRPVPKPPVNPPPAKNKSFYTIRQYYTQAIYPRVICYDPGDLLAGATMNCRPWHHGSNATRSGMWPRGPYKSVSISSAR